MSGSPGFTFSSSPSDQSCEKLTIHTRLASPVPNVVATLTIGQILTIRLSSVVGPIEAVTDQGNVAGAILTTKLTQLINCITSGTAYVARVLSINGGDCQVSIYCP